MVGMYSVNYLKTIYRDYAREKGVRILTDHKLLQLKSTTR